MGKNFAECGGLACLPQAGRRFYGVSDAPGVSAWREHASCKADRAVIGLTPRKREQDSRTPKRLALGTALHAAALVIGSCYITDVRTGIPNWTLMLLAVAASLTAGVARQAQAPATPAANTVSQDQAKTSTKTSPSPRGRKIPCKTPQNASLCYWTHGRMSVYNGSPSFRIWQIGTRHMLGVFNGPSHYPARTNDDFENPELPSELYRAYEADNRALKRATWIMWAIPPPAFADFEVCPLRQEIKGWMQAVCVESAKNIFIEKDD